MMGVGIGRWLGFLEFFGSGVFVFILEIGFFIL